MPLKQRSVPPGIGAIISVGLAGWEVSLCYISRPRPLAIPSEADFLRMVTRIEHTRNRVTQLRLWATVTRDSVAFHCYLNESTAIGGYGPDPRD